MGWPGEWLVFKAQPGDKWLQEVDNWPFGATLATAMDHPEGYVVYVYVYVTEFFNISESLMHLFVNLSFVVNLWKTFELGIPSCANKRIMFSQK